VIEDSKVKWWRKLVKYFGPVIFLWVISYKVPNLNTSKLQKRSTPAVLDNDRQSLQSLRANMASFYIKNENQTKATPYRIASAAGLNFMFIHRIRPTELVNRVSTYRFVL